MFFSVKELERRRVTFNVAFRPGEIDFDRTLHQVTLLDAQGAAELVGNALGEIRVRGHLTVTMEADCDRCLEAARFPVESDFDLFYVPSALGDSDTAGELEIGEAESGIGFYEGGGLELKDILREQVLLSMPMQKVCSPTCLGICPVCGQNRNAAPCGCAVQTTDDRWSALKNLKTRGA